MFRKSLIFGILLIMSTPNIINAGVICDSLLRNEGNEPVILLHKAICEGNYDEAKKLVNNGADVNQTTKAKDCWSKGCSHFLYTSLVLVLEESPYNTKKRKEVIDMVKFLIKKGADVNKPAIQMDAEEDRHLIKFIGSYAEITPLMAAITSFSDIEIIKFLLESGADPNYKPSKLILNRPLPDCFEPSQPHEIDVIVDAEKGIQFPYDAECLIISLTTPLEEAKSRQATHEGIKQPELVELYAEIVRILEKR